MRTLEALRGMGFNIEVRGDRVRVQYPGPKPPAEARPLLDDLRHNKPQVLALLRQQPETLPELGVQTIIPFTPCGLCGAGTWTAYGGMPRCQKCVQNPASASQRLFRRALEQWWHLVALGPDADQAEVIQVWQTLIALRDDVGEPRATALQRGWAREWYRTLKTCPWCGERGAFHEPEERSQGCA